MNPASRETRGAPPSDSLSRPFHYVIHQVPCNHPTLLSDSMGKCFSEVWGTIEEALDFEVDPALVPQTISFTSGNRGPYAETLYTISQAKDTDTLRQILPSFYDRCSLASFPSRYIHFTVVVSVEAASCDRTHG